MKHLLTVDDDPALCSMITDYLVDYNLRVSAAANDAEMSRVLATGAADLLILDVKQGDEDGLDLLRALRADSLSALRLLEKLCLGRRSFSNCRARPGCSSRRAGPTGTMTWLEILLAVALLLIALGLTR